MLKKKKKMTQLLSQKSKGLSVNLTIRDKHHILNKWASFEKIWLDC